MSALTVGGWYGCIGVEILSGSDCVAVVGRMQSNRLDALGKVRSASAKRDERAYHADVEAQGLEGHRAEALPLARLFAAAPDLLAACRAALDDDDDCPIRGETRAALRSAVARAEGRL
ncbi:MAG: hypothetical protein Q8P41_31925 [Pseudomonadota bacterium]|nr:hypothetical protein [Pseudomonadota bacterium]